MVPICRALLAGACMWGVCQAAPAKTCKLDGMEGDYPAPSVQTEALIIAARKGDLRMAHQLQGAGVPLDERNEDGDVALIVAAKEGHFTFARFLVRVGVDVDIVDRLGRTALMHAAMADEATTVDVLADVGADIEVRDTDGATALLLAAKVGAAESVDTLVALEADAAAADTHGLTPLHYASRTGNTEIVELLLAALEHDRTSVFKSTSHGATPLMFAAHSGHTEVCKLLLAATADAPARIKLINTVDADKQSALQHAVAGGHGDDVALLLLAEGADPALRNVDGRTALMLSAARCRKGLFVPLLAASLPTAPAPDTAQRSLVWILSDVGCLTLLRVLARHSAADTLFSPAVNAADKSGLTPLMAAAGNGRLKTIAFLLQQGADLHATDNLGRTARRVALDNNMAAASRRLEA